MSDKIRLQVWRLKLKLGLHWWQRKKLHPSLEQTLRDIKTWEKNNKRKL